MTIVLGAFFAAGLALAATPQAMLERHKCNVCHADAEARTGPAYVDIAAANQGKPDAVAFLVATVRKGRHGNGPWQMPPHPEVSKADAEAMVRYILSLRR